MKKLYISVYPPSKKDLRKLVIYCIKPSNSSCVDGFITLKYADAILSKISWLESSSFAPASARGGEEDDVAGPSPGRNLLLIFKWRPMTLKIYIIRTSKMEFFYTYWKRLQSTKEKEEPNNCKSYHQLYCLVFAIFCFT